MENEGIELRQYLGVIRRWLWLIVLGTFLAGATALVVSFRMTPVYQAEAGVLIVTAGSEIVLEPQYRTLTQEDLAPIINMQERRKALTALVTNTTIASQVIEELGSTLEPKECEAGILVGMVKAELDGDLIRIQVESDSPKKATAIANAWANAYESYVNSLYVGTSQAPADLQIQADEALPDYQEAEAALAEFLGNNQIDELNREIEAKKKLIASYKDAQTTSQTAAFEQQLATKRQVLADYYADLIRLEELLADARALQKQLERGVASPSAATGDALAVMFLRAKAFASSASLPVQLQISLKEGVGETAGQQAEDVKALIDVLEAQRGETQAQIDKMSSQLLTSKEYELAPSALDPMSRLIDQYSQEVLQLQEQLEREGATQRELTSARDLTWETYQVVVRKVAEVKMAAQAEATVVRFAVPATEPESPIRPRKKLNTLLASVVGAMLAIGAVFTLEYLDQSITTPEDVAKAVGLPTLGSIVAFQTKGETQPVVLRDPLSPAAESFRMLRTRLEAAMDETPAALLIAGPTAREGKSTIAANLAVVLAQANASVILVDSDLRRPVLHTLFGLPNDKGLSDILAEEHPDLDHYLRNTEVKNLRLFSSGPLPPNPSELLQSARIKTLVDELKSKADVVIFDSPAILAVTDADVLGKHVDGVLLVIEAGRTERETTRIASERLATVGSKILGVVLNKVSPSKVSFYYYKGESGHRAKQRILRS